MLQAANTELMLQAANTELMLQAANTDLINPSVPQAHNIKSQNLLFPLQIKPVKSVKASLRIFILCILGTNGLYLPINSIWTVTRISYEQIHSFMYWSRWKVMSR